MKITRPTNTHNSKRLCIYISEEKDGDTTITTIDYVGDEGLLQKYHKDVLREKISQILKE